ncbi:autotransporter outer membrane beta-barrel domain-containing protein [uncultured Dialister sp.]|uniref:autotransporter outer membrane beta-barrel domain-containing protein n=1 Tax=uncultured Dialister sp. TaxID=278064 RepID=UPI00260E0DE7|nr:autotransporter outer membrane beta-barrel domain-containing protein [uncultured Dialister sp.]
MPSAAEAAVQTAPLVVTDKDKVIDDDFNVKGHTYATAIYVAPSSTGTVQVNSNTVHVENGGQTQEDTGVIDTGYGWNGTLNLKSGMQISGDFTGNGIRARGIQLNGFQLFNATNDTGKPYAGTAQLGDHISVSLTGNKATESAGLYGIEVDGENLQAGSGLTSSVSVHTGTWGEVFGLGVIHYGKAQIGDSTAIKVKTQVDGESTHLISDAVQTVHNWNNETYDKPAKGRQTLSIGKDAVISTEFHNEKNYTLTQSEAIAIRLSHTDFTLGNEAQIYATTTGTIGSVYGIYTDYHTNAKIGDNMTNVVTANGRADFVMGLIAQNDANAGEVDEGVEDILSIGKRGKTLVSYVGDSKNVDTRGVENYGALVKLGEGNTIQASARNTGTHGTGTGVYGIKMNAAGRFEADQGLQIKVNADNESAAYGIRQDNGSNTSIRNYFTNTVTASDTDETYGVFSQNSKFTIGEDGLNEVQAKGKAQVVTGVKAQSDAKAGEGDEGGFIGKKGKTFVSYEGDSGNIVTRGLENDGALIHLGTENTIQASAQNTGTHGTGASTYGIKMDNSGRMEAEQGLQVNVNAVNETLAFGIRQNNSSTTDIQDHYVSTVQASDTNEVYGALSVNSKLAIGDHSLNKVQVKGQAPYFWIAGYDIEGKMADGSLNLKLENQSHTVVSYDGDTSSNVQLFGLYNNALSQIGDDASISVSAPALSNGYVYGIYNLYGTTELGDGASVLLDTTAVQNAAVFSAAKGNVLFDGGMKVQTGEDQDALSAKAEGSITALGEGTKQIYGNLLSMGSGTINLKLDTADSLLRGKSAVESGKNLSGVLTEGTTNLTLANGARWDMTADSTVTSLLHNNGGVVNMEYNPHYEHLDVGSYSGNGGIFRMKSDLGQDNKSGFGDKVHIDSSAAGASGKIQVHDESFLTGQEVTGEKHELMITDDSGKATFTGLTLDDGGLWDVTPTIQNGKYVREVMGYGDAKDTEWYLTKLQRTINQSTKTLLHATDNTYALYRNSIDTLRQRMGELRFRDKKEDVSGLWARDTHGAYSGDGVYSKYNRLQLGYDYAANRKSIYGFLFERGIGNPRYENGSGKDHTFAGALYGTWFGDCGSYTDVVAKVGRDDTTLHSYGEWPDSASFRTREESLSIEYGRTHTLNKKGLFLEPQAQVVFGHLDSKDYTTGRGKTVHMDSFNSAIGRLGILLGQRKTEGNHPFDYYAKFSVLHEFGGNRDYYLTAPDGETMTTSMDYRDTWYEAGFGGTYRINGSTCLYADGEREFGGTWNRKWQWNVGIHWTF